MSRVFVICNTAEALRVIAQRGIDLSKENLITCNHAFQFFRTEKLHYNVMADYEDIMTFVKNEFKLSLDYQRNVIQIFSSWNKGKGLTNLDYDLIVNKGLVTKKGEWASSGIIAALLSIDIFIMSEKYVIGPGEIFKREKEFFPELKNVVLWEPK